MKKHLINMLTELNNYRRDRNILMEIHVTERLNQSFNQYDKELQQGIQFLTRKHEKSLLKRINKLNDRSS